jgi:DNA-directed RNA polymerase subunit RPC12/RpoP
MGLLMKDEAYSGKDIQMCMSMLKDFEGDGVTDSRFIRQRLQDALTKRMGTLPRVNVGRKMWKGKAEPVTAETKCPECGSLHWRASRDTEGQLYILCKDCQHLVLLGDR